MWRLAAFSGVEILTYALMANHFHILVKVPERAKFLRRFEGEGGEERLLEHLSLLYSKAYVGAVRQELARVGLAEKADTYPAHLSGGQKQRVAIARALAMEPEMLLFDEPTSALDPEIVNEVLAAIQELARDGMTMVVVTHELGFARRVADRIMMMDAGRIVEASPAQEFFAQPRDPRTRELLGLG